MKFVTSALVAVAALASAPLAHAQVAAYGMVTAYHLGGLSYTTVGNTPGLSFTTRTDGSINPIGGTGGIYYDFRQIGPVRLGVDGRFTVAATNHGADPSAAGSGGRLYTITGGLRGSFPVPPRFHILAPYAQANFGVARSDFGNGGANGPNPSNGQVQIDHGFTYQGLAGLDVHALPALDIRLFEVGIGGVSGVSGQSGSHLLESLSIGVVLHLP